MARHLNWDREHKRINMYAYPVDNEPTPHDDMYELLVAEARARAEKNRMEEFLAKKAMETCTKRKGDNAMECKLGQALGCEGMKVDGTCGIHLNEGVARRIEQGFCVFKNIRAPQKGIYAPKSAKKLNPQKAAKAEARNKAVSQI